jgi:GNAT superfamily N-acetyltransferase
MFYDQVKVKEINSPEEYKQAHELLSKEFPDHRETDLLDQYEWILIAKESNKIIGIVTGNKYIPFKALLCDIVVQEEYRSKGVGIKLMKEFGIHLMERGFKHLVGFTPKKSKAALNTYKRVHTKQEEMIVTTSEIQISVAHVEQMECVLRAREERNKKNKERGK